MNCKAATIVRDCVQCLVAHSPFSLSLTLSDKTVKLWKISERDKRPEGYNLKDEDGRIRDPATITSLRVSTILTRLLLEASLQCYTINTMHLALTIQ